MPIINTRMAMPRNVAPRGLPSWWRVLAPDCADAESGEEEEDEEPELRRNNCVIAMPMEANASDVRSQARKVRSI